MMPTTTPLWIVVLNYNGADDTIRCLRSLLPGVSAGAAVVVVDNASLVDPGPAVRDLSPDVYYIRNPVNTGYAGGNNTGIRYALEHGAEWVCLLNNDTEVAPDFAAALLEQAGAADGYGVIGPLIMAMNEPSTVMTDGCRFNPVGDPSFFVRQVVAPGAPLTEVDIVNGCCLVISAAALGRVGLIDEAFFLVHEESDLCLRVQAAGFKCGVFGRPLVWHKGSTSFRRTGNGLQRYFDARNLWLLLAHDTEGAKWGRAGRAPLKYFRYVYHRYCVEHEDGQKVAVRALLDGVHDALFGRFGVRRQSRRPLVFVMRVACELLRLAARLKPAFSRSMVVIGQRDASPGRLPRGQ
jgi:GT2 family glycosyltransferase